MKIGIISDTHDNIWRLNEALVHLQKTDLILHCGDLISPFMVHQLGKNLGDIPVHMVWGNNDGDRRAVTIASNNYPTLQIHGDFFEVDLDGIRIAINHYPEIGRALASSGKYDLVCYGHDHTAHREEVGGTVLLNPGEIMGLNGRSTLAIYDTRSWKVQSIQIWEG